jgi:predicted DNA-binding transcriptional regulator YafY
VTKNERENEILRILLARRQETMPNLARELGVSVRTICSDIKNLTVGHHLYTVQGKGGCVKVEDGYQPHKHIFSREQETVLTEILGETDESRQRKVLMEMLAAYGSPAIRKKYEKEIQLKNYARCVNANTGKTL